MTEPGPLPDEPAPPPPEPPEPAEFTAAAPAPRPLPSRDPQPEPAAPQSSRSALPVLTAIGFIFVLLATAWVWNSELDLGTRLANLPPPPPPGADPARVAALESQMKALDRRLTVLENRPPPAPPPAPAAAPVLSTDTTAALTSQMAELEDRLKAAEQRQGSLAQQEARAQVVQHALAALDAGEALGEVPGAPPAASRFAKTRPPTEASLRLAYPAAAEAALAASRPSADGKSFGERILMHASSLVTVKESGRVVIGPPAATVLGDAQARLEAGDLAGTLTALDALDTPAAQAMAGWRAEAKALLDARAALSQMARG